MTVMAFVSDLLLDSRKILLLVAACRQTIKVL